MYETREFDPTARTVPPAPGEGADQDSGDDGHPGGAVRLAAFFSASELFVPGLVERLAAGHPSVRLETYDEDVSQDDFAGLVADYDIVVAHRSDDTEPPPRSGVAVAPLLREPLDVAVPLDHPLAGRASVGPAELTGETWVAPPVGFPIEQALVALSSRAGQPARVARRTTHLPLMERLVARGSAWRCCRVTAPSTTPRGDSPWCRSREFGRVATSRPCYGPTGLRDAWSR